MSKIPKIHEKTEPEASAGADLECTTVPSCRGRGPSGGGRWPNLFKLDFLGDVVTSGLKLYHSAFGNSFRVDGSWILMMRNSSRAFLL